MEDCYEFEASLGKHSQLQVSLGYRERSPKTEELIMMVAHIFKPSIWEVEAGVYPRLHSEMKNFLKTRKKRGRRQKEKS